MTRRSCQSRLFPSLFVLLALLAISVIPGSAQSTHIKETPSAARMRALNNSLLHLHGQMQKATPAEARLLRSQAATAIAQRQQALLKLIQDEPHSALTFAFSPELLSDLATKFPQSAALLESHVTVSGKAQHWIADYPGYKNSRSIWQMNSVGHSLSLYFAGREPSDLKPNEVLQATGVVSGSQMAVESSAVVRQGAALNPAQGTGEILARASHVQPWSGFLLMMGGIMFGLPGAGRSSKRIWKRVFDGVRHLAVVILAIAVAASLYMPVYAQNSCSTKGVQNTAVLMVNLPNGSLPAGVTTSSLQDVFFAKNTPGTSMDGFLREASYGQTSAAGDVFGPFNLTGTYTSCTDVGGSLLSDAIAAAQASGVNFSNYSRVFVVFPDVFNCGWQGYAASGCTTITPNGTLYNFSTAYISAAYATPRSSGVQLATHEVGHNLGLLHSGKLAAAVTTDVIGPLSSPGNETDLGDYWTTMSGSQGLYTAPQNAETLGWFPSASNVLTVTSSGTYTVQPLENATSGVQALKIQRGSGNPGYNLWVEYRQPIDSGYDSTLLAAAYTGALIHYEEPGQSGGVAHSYLPNFTPSDTTTYSSPLAAGHTWTDPYSNLSISVVSATSSSLTVNVNYGATPCTTAAPTVTVSPLNPSIYPGQSAGYSAVITDNDSSGCSANTFTFSSTAPSNWSTSFSSSTITLSPGQSTSITMAKGAPAGTAAGTYAVDLAATTSSSNSSGTANATVMTPPSLAVALSVSTATVTPPATQSITAVVTSGGAPASGATVTFTLTAPNGSITKQSATTNSNGAATWNYKLNSKSAAGTYSVVAQAATTSGTRKNSTTTQTATSTAVSFFVQ